MEKRIFDELLDTLKSGTAFTATIESTHVTGKVEVSQERKRIWLCFDKGPSGDVSPNKHGYNRSWVIAYDTHHHVKEFTILQGVEDTSGSTVDTGNYPVGAHVVLLTIGEKKSKLALLGNSIPTDYVYKLRQAYQKGNSGFYPARDLRGSVGNGYSTSDSELRAATVDEIAEYQKNDSPCAAISPIIQVVVTPQIINHYEIY